MSADPPADYVAFVARRLPQVRDRVAREVPAAAADQAEVVGEVLADLAGWWGALRAATRWWRPDAIEHRLELIVRRRGRLWRERQIYPVEVTVWDAGSALPPETTGTPRAAPVAAPAWWSSIALRRAAVLESTVRPPLATLADASVAWWHAYEARRRAARIARLTLATLIFLILLVSRQ